LEQTKPELKLTVFSDYICPFCYVGDARLKHLRESYQLRINWCFLEIHPETPPEGAPVTSLDYSAGTWGRMMAALDALAREEGLVIREHDFTTNSRAALQLAEVAKFTDRDTFYRLHSSLFEAFFCRGENIGDPGILQHLGREAGLSSDQVQQAWRDQSALRRLQQYRTAARELNVRATPTVFAGDRRLDGVVPFDQMLEAARAAL
jgi:predicted DsbA family dithiol-disulfide isomerase